MPARPDRGPRTGLRGGGRGERRLEPGAGRGSELVEHVSILPRGYDRKRWRRLRGRVRNLGAELALVARYRVSSPEHIG